MLRQSADAGERATPNGNVNPATKVSNDATPIPTLGDLGITRDQSFSSNDYIAQHLLSIAKDQRAVAMACCIASWKFE
ncbi:hypothetical protein AWB71_00673 [Caballeronia peredens]|nr:hypothetical protein AWB71_00673 [Caballeronia peredens]